MKLTDLSPRWTSSGEGRHGMGITFLCPLHLESCEAGRVGVPFANPVDGGAAFEGTGARWQREGETFETLTLSPSILVRWGPAGSSASDLPEHWHGWVRAGSVT